MREPRNTEKLTESEIAGQELKLPEEHIVMIVKVGLWRSIQRGFFSNDYRMKGGGNLRKRRAVWGQKGFCGWPNNPLGQPCLTFKS